MWCIGPRLLSKKIIGSSSVSPFVVVATTPLYFFFYKRKERDPLLKFQTYFPILYYSSLVLFIFLPSGSCGSYLGLWLYFMGVDFSFWYDDFKCLNDVYWNVVFVEIRMMELTCHLLKFFWFISAWWFDVVSWFVLLHVLIE